MQGNEARPPRPFRTDFRSNWTTMDYVCSGGGILTFGYVEMFQGNSKALIRLYVRVGQREHGLPPKHTSCKGCYRSSLHQKCSKQQPLAHSIAIPTGNPRPAKAQLSALKLTSLRFKPEPETPNPGTGSSPSSSAFSQLPGRSRYAIGELA